MIRRSRFNKFVVGDPHRHVGQLPLPAALGLIAFDGHDRHFRRPQGEFPLPIGHQRLGAHQQHAADLPGVQQQADRRDRLHRFAQPHFVGQHRRDSRIEKRHAFELIRKRHEREIERAAGDQRFQRRLQHIEEPIFELDDIGRRLETRDGFWNRGRLRLRQ